MAPSDHYTVQMVPSDHPYCRHVLPPDRPPVYALRPDPPVPGAPAGQWWPPRALDADWLRENVPDVLHVHFGFDSYTPEQLQQVVYVLRAAGSALVVTVHDLHNPHFTDRSRHLAQLDVLIPAADEVLTLTRPAAAEILARWDRAATVVPHPHIVPLDRIPARAADRPGRRRARWAGPGSAAADREIVIGVHAKDLRANVDPFSALPGVAGAVRRLRGRGVAARVRVDVREDPQDAEALGRLRAECAAYGFDLWEHGRLGDDALHADLRSLDVTVLPYAFGTHSGWLEMCRDLGVPVAVPDLGCFAGQATSPAIETFAPGDAAALADAVLALLDRRDAIRPADRSARRAQREAVAAEHERLYARALAAARSRQTVGA
ncbi:glycosyltransferase family 1 protein [Citricoccus sp.]|uniref:glycosyltransferase family 1 protein n=1 Tax=Citricoccus sp. TaxID=1978372 RepID=UPI002C24C525|nr:glycosyltransferase family 1 protein [Citricoccus sp.]HRO92356.1 glycosyltransferase family 1 protein [Citricoccus sp.]